MTRSSQRWSAVCALAAMLTLHSPLACAQDGARLVRLARVGPWPAVSGLIGYGDRLWFANSVKFRDHNSADIYSYDPRTGAVRYERHLFSQDAGRPAVAKGLLYWPFEDGRFSAGYGEYMVTNGRDWRWRTLPYPRVPHIHAMRAQGQALFAATGGFVAVLHRSDDGGLGWRVIYEHRNAPDSFSRLISLGELGGELHAGIEADEGKSVKLLKLREENLAPVPGWPAGASADALTEFRGWLYALHHADGKTRLWRTDGRTSQPVKGLETSDLRALAAGPDALWAVSAGAGGGALWRSRNGTSWQRIQQFSEDAPIDVTVYAGRVYVGAIGADGRGVLLGPPTPAPVRAAQSARPLPEVPPVRDRRDPQDALAALDGALADFGAFEANGGSLAGLLEPLVAMRTREIGDALARRLGRVPRDALTTRLAGRRVPAADRADWLLLWAIARTGKGQVPLSLLDKPFEEPQHRSEKYAEAAPGAAWAMAEAGQADAETLARMVMRLHREGDPAWVAGDMVGALTALTGCRFGYDGKAWREWIGTGSGCAGKAAGPAADLVPIPGGRFTIGDADGEPDERPREVSVGPFGIMRHEVTNREFAEFIAASGHVTDPERSGTGYVWNGRWREIAGADWRHPSGPGSSLQDLDRHPVVQVSARDAAAYCSWHGLRLPSEEEWEVAARGADARRYPWGNQAPTQRGARRANFGTEACCAPDASDGYARTAPVGKFPAGASAYGLQDMAGNVWEWTTSPYAGSTGELAIRGGGWGNDAYCLRASYRHGNPPDIGLDMVGFRCAGGN